MSSPVLPKRLIIWIVLVAERLTQRLLEQLCSGAFSTSALVSTVTRLKTISWGDAKFL